MGVKYSFTLYIQDGIPRFSVSICFSILVPPPRRRSRDDTARIRYGERYPLVRGTDERSSVYDGKDLSKISFDSSRSVLLTCNTPHSDLYGHRYSNLQPMYYERPLRPRPGVRLSSPPDV